MEEYFTLFNIIVATLYLIWTILTGVTLYIQAREEEPLWFGFTFVASPVLIIYWIVKKIIK